MVENTEANRILYALSPYCVECGGDLARGGGKGAVVCRPCFNGARAANIFATWVRRYDELNGKGRV